MATLRLKEIMKEQGISGKDLAQKVEVTENTISFIATGKTQPRFELLAKIAEVLNVDIRELFHTTKGDPSETIYALRNGKYVPVGKLNQ